MDIKHIHLKVKDVEKSREFYETVFDFKLDFKCSEEEVFLRTGGGFVLGLQKLDEPGNLPPWFHMGFECHDEDEVNVIYKKVGTSKGKVLREIQDRGGALYFFCMDPDGTKVEVYFNRT